MNSTRVTGIFHGTVQVRSGRQGSAEPVKTLSGLPGLTDDHPLPTDTFMLSLILIKAGELLKKVIPQRFTSNI